MNPEKRNDHANVIIDMHNLILQNEILTTKQNNWKDILQMHPAYCSLNNKSVQYN